MKFWIHSILAGAIAIISIASSARAEGPDHEQEVASIIRYICSDGGDWLRCYSLSPSECLPRMKEVVTPCTNAALKAAKVTLTQEQQTALAARVVQCFNRVFMSKYGKGKVESAECKEAPRHLQ